VAKLLEKKLPTEEIVEELYLAAWARRPSVTEKAKAVKLISEASNQQEALQDLLWALLNSPAFLFNR